MEPICTVCRSPFLVDIRRQTYGSNTNILRPRKKVIARLNLFGKAQHNLPRLGKRSFTSNPLHEGDVVCSRSDCIYHLEKLYTQRKRSKTTVNVKSDPLNSSDVVIKPRLERYRTSTQAVIVLLKCLSEHGIDVSKSVIADICGRRGDTIATHLSPLVSRVVTNDLAGEVDTSLDATREDFPQKFGAIVGRIDIIITSPPYSSTVKIISNALQLARQYTIAKLPLNFLVAGPQCHEKRQFLQSSPPTSIIPLSRSDNSEYYRINMDEAWFVWKNDNEKNLLPSFVYPQI